MTVCGTEWLCEWGNVRIGNQQPLECCSGSPTAFQHVLFSSHRACSYSQRINSQQMHFTIWHTWHTLTAAFCGTECHHQGVTTNTGVQANLQLYIFFIRMNIIMFDYENA